MESELSMNSLFCFVFPPSRSANRAALFRRGNHGAREEDAEGMFQPTPTDSRCRRDAEAWV